MILPNADKAVIERAKLQKYLLSSSHPVGQFKAEFFAALGFTDENWDVLENEIWNLLGNDAKTKEKTEYGQKYEIRGIISGPTGRKAEIVTAWIILKEEKIPRLITAYPREL